MGEKALIFIKAFLFVGWTGQLWNCFLKDLLKFSCFVVLKNEAFRQEEFNRRKKVDFFDKTIYVVSPEDLLISKLIWIQDFQSPQQMEDIKNLAVIEHLDWPYIKTWINKLNLKSFNLLKV